MKIISKKEVRRRIKVFTGSVRKYQKLFNLMNWELTVTSQLKDGVRASCYYSHNRDDICDGRLATISYSYGWIHERDLDDVEIEKVAFHEVMELLLSNFMGYVQTDKRVDPWVVQTEVHNIIRTFENNIYPKLGDE